MNRVPLQDRVVFLQLEPFGRILPVLGRDVPAHPGHSTILVFRALEDYLYPVAFLCHILPFLRLSN